MVCQEQKNDDPLWQPVYESNHFKCRERRQMRRKPFRRSVKNIIVILHEMTCCPRWRCFPCNFFFQFKFSAGRNHEVLDGFDCPLLCSLWYVYPSGVGTDEEIFSLRNNTPKLSSKCFSHQVVKFMQSCAWIQLNCLAAMSSQFLERFLSKWYFQNNEPIGRH